MTVNEPLDYCRVKKISEKGYGFLTSLYYSENVFFHFNGIKDPVVKDKLEKLKRGELYFYFTSISKNNKRRVYKLWLDISEVEEELIPGFVERIVEEFIFGRTNPFEVAHVIKQLRENSKMEFDSFEKILHSDKLLKTPSILLAMLTEKELRKKNKIEQLVEQLESQQIKKDEWIKLIIDELDYNNDN